MTHEYASRKESYRYFDIFIDYMGFQAMDVLKIHRNEFAEGFEFEEYVSRYMEVYLHLYRLFEQKKFKIKEMPYQRTKKFLLVRLLLTTDEDDLKYLEQVIKKYYEESYADYLVEKYNLNVAIKESEKATIAEGVETGRKEFIFEYRRDLDSLYSFYKKYILLLNQHQNTVLLLESSNSAGKTVEAKTRQNIMRWCEENSLYIDIGGDDNITVNRNHVIKNVIRNGVYVELEDFLPLLFEKHMFSNKYCIIFSDDDEWKKGFYVFNSSESKDSNRDEKDFYELSYGEHNRQAILSDMEFIYYYKELLVEKLPYNINTTSNNSPYLISPITNKLRMKFDKSAEMVLRKRMKISQKAFIEEVMKEEEFEFLVSWVAKYTIVPAYRGNKVAVREKYKEYIGNIFTFNEQKLAGKEKGKKKTAYIRKMQGNPEPV